jgi:hypothetical protein
MMEIGSPTKQDFEVTVKPAGRSMFPLKTEPKSRLSLEEI